MAWYKLHNLNILFPDGVFNQATSSDAKNTSLFTKSSVMMGIPCTITYRRASSSSTSYTTYNPPRNFSTTSASYSYFNYSVINSFYNRYYNSNNSYRQRINKGNNTSNTSSSPNYFSHPLSFYFTYKDNNGLNWYNPNNGYFYTYNDTELTTLGYSSLSVVKSVILNGSYIIKYNISSLTDVFKSFKFKPLITFSDYNDNVLLDGNRIRGLATSLNVNIINDEVLSNIEEIDIDSSNYDFYFTTGTSSNNANLSLTYKLTNYGNSTIVFNNVEVHEDFAKFILAIADSQDQIALTFGDSVVLANKPVTEISVVKKTLNLVDVTIDGVTSEVEIHPQEDKVFLGFSLQENSTVATVPIGTTKITLNENTVFYEVWGTYKPEPNFFTANFYKNSAEGHRVDKTEYLTSVFSAGISLREETNIIYPTILLQYDKVPDFNYCYIEYFGRYYYVTDITSIRNNIWQISLSVDVLMSFKDTIKTQMGNVIRQENIGNSMMVDDNIPVLGQPRILINSMGSPIFSGEYNTPLSDGNEVCFVLLTQGKRIEV